MRALLPVHRIARSFHISVRSVRPIKKGVYQVRTKTGDTFSLKRMNYPGKRLLWIDQVLRAMRQNGFDAISWREPRTETGKVLYVRDEKKRVPYILTPWIPGPHPAPRSEEDLALCAMTLARFHIAGQPLGHRHPGAFDALGQWPSYLKRRTNALIKAVEKAHANDWDTSPVAQLLRVHGNAWIRQAEGAQKLLSAKDYSALCKTARKVGALCHGDSGAKNFIMTPSGPFLIDFETLRIDLRTYDLFRFIHLTGKKNGWDFPLIRSALASYDEISRLRAEEYSLLPVWLLFPQKVCRLAARWNQTGRSSELLLHQLYKTIRERRETERFVREFTQTY